MLTNPLETFKNSSRFFNFGIKFDGAEVENQDFKQISIAIKIEESLANNVFILLLSGRLSW